MRRLLLALTLVTALLAPTPLGAGPAHRFYHATPTDYPGGFHLYVLHGSKSVTQAPGPNVLLYRRQWETDPPSLVAQASAGGFAGIYIDVCDWRDTCEPTIRAIRAAGWTGPLVTNGWPFHSYRQYRRDPAAVARALRYIDGFQIEKFEPRAAFMLDNHRDLLVLAMDQDPDARTLRAFERHAGPDHYYGNRSGRRTP